MELSTLERALLVELKRNPGWASLLSKLSPSAPPRYKPAPGNDAEKLHEWIYRSGVYDGANNVIDILKYERQTE